MVPAAGDRGLGWHRCFPWRRAFAMASVFPHRAHELPDEFAGLKGYVIPKESTSREMRILGWSMHPVLHSWARCFGAGPLFMDGAIPMGLRPVAHRQVMGSARRGLH